MRVFLAILLSVPLFHLQAGAVIEASGELAADTRDEHGDTIGGIGSGLIYNAKDDTFLAVSDRGPGDGTLPYRPRVVVLKIPQHGDRLEPRVVKSIILRDEQGRDMTGLIPDDPDSTVPRMKDGRTCIDPEALALAQNGTLYITDEYGPYLYHFNAEGKMLRCILLPDLFTPRNALGGFDFTDKAQIVSGRNINQGPEGMCLLPDGKTAALIFQSGIAQDGPREQGLTRMLLLDLATGKPTAMYFYRMSPAEAGVGAEKLSVNDLAALDATRFLVLEREGLGRDGSKHPGRAGYKSVWLIDTRPATNLLAIDKTPRVISLQKRLLFNLPALVRDPTALAAKWESIAILPPVEADAVTLMMAADNDFLAPVIHHEGGQYPFSRAEDSVPTQFYKIRTPLPENP